MGKYVQIKDNPKLFRDESSKAIINTDVQAFENYMINKRKKIDEKKEFETLKSDVNELKDLVKTLINKIG